MDDVGGCATVMIGSTEALSREALATTTTTTRVDPLAAAVEVRGRCLCRWVKKGVTQCDRRHAQ